MPSWVAAAALSRDFAIAAMWHLSWIQYGRRSNIVRYESSWSCEVDTVSRGYVLLEYRLWIISADAAQGMRKWGTCHLLTVSKIPRPCVPYFNSSTAAGSSHLTLPAILVDGVSHVRSLGSQCAFSYVIAYSHIGFLRVSCLLIGLFLHLGWNFVNFDIFFYWLHVEWRENDSSLYSPIMITILWVKWRHIRFWWFRQSNIKPFVVVEEGHPRSWPLRLSIWFTFLSAKGSHLRCWPTASTAILWFFCGRESSQFLALHDHW